MNLKKKYRVTSNTIKTILKFNETESVHDIIFLIAPIFNPLSVYWIYI